MKRVVFVLLFLIFSFYSYAEGLYHLTVIGTGDLQGALNSTSEHGGIASIATVIKKIEKNNPNGTLVVSTGDDLMGRYFDKFEGKAIYTLMYDAGYRFCALGNHEFDYGDKVLAKALGYAKCTILCSDLKIKGTSLEGKCKKYVILNRGGIKIGLFSLITQKLPLISSPGDVKLIAGNIDMARKMISFLRSKKVDVIIALTHIGFSHDEALAKRVKGITLIFGGHSHLYLKKDVIENGTVIVNGGSFGRYLVRVDLYFNSDKEFLPKLTKYKLIPVNSSVKKDNKIEIELAKFTSKLPKAIILGRTNTGFDLREMVLRFSESGFADTVNDILREKFKVDIVLNNSGLFRGDKIIPKGPVTDVMLHNIFLFNNVAFLLKLKGKYIKQILEHSADSYGRGGWLQVSGLKYIVDLRKPEGKRVLEVYIDGKPLDPNKIYTVLTNDFLARGGNGYFWFKKYGEDLTDTYTSFYSTIASYTNKNGYLNEKKPDGRIRIIMK